MRKQFAVALALAAVLAEAAVAGAGGAALAGIGPFANGETEEAAGNPAPAIGPGAAEAPIVALAAGQEGASDGGRASDLLPQCAVEALAKWDGPTSEDGAPLPFEGRDAPLEQEIVARYGNGRALLESGHTLIEGKLAWYIDWRGESLERMEEIAREYGFEPAESGGYWHKALDCGQLVVIVPDGVSLEEAAAVLWGIEGTEGVAELYVSEGGFKMLDLNGNPDASTKNRIVVPPSDYLGYHVKWGRFVQAWENATCDNEITVAVLDTGFPSESISDLAPNVDYDRAYDATGGDGTDNVGHGTAVASVISAVADQVLCTGCSYNATILPVKVCDGEEFEQGPNGYYDLSNLWRAFDHLLSLDNPPDVVNMSFGGKVCERGIASWDAEKLQRYIERINKQLGCVVVAASGNNGGFDARFPLNLDIDNSELLPASFEEVISVGSLQALSSDGPHDGLEDIGSYLHLSPFSNTSSNVDIVAFGEYVPVLQLSLLGIEKRDAFTGMSFAAPQVAAAAALVKRAHPGYTPNEVKRALIETAIHPSDFSDEKDADGRDDEGRYGYGALDAAAAVAWQKETPPEPEGPSGDEQSPITGGSFAEMFRDMRG